MEAAFCSLQAIDNTIIISSYNGSCSHDSGSKNKADTANIKNTTPPISVTVIRKKVSTHVYTMSQQIFRIFPLHREYSTKINCSSKMITNVDKTLKMVCLELDN